MPRRSAIAEAQAAGVVLWEMKKTAARDCWKEIERTVHKLADVDSIEEDPEQPRMEFDDEKLAELAETIRARGVRQPVSVRRHPVHALARDILSFLHDMPLVRQASRAAPDASRATQRQVDLPLTRPDPGRDK
jgi:hypothetical protein